MSDLPERYKTCGRCIHDEDGDIVGSACYLCKRNPSDHRIDWFEERRLVRMNNLENWTEVAKGLYRYVIASRCCYEIIITFHDHKTDILSANAELYVVDDFTATDGSKFFAREHLLTGLVAACLEKAIEDYIERGGNKNDI